MDMNSLKLRLDKEVAYRNRDSELSYERPDPLLVASRYKDEKIALICALFAYGNAKQIVKFLDSLDFSLLEASEDKIRQNLQGFKYRFQTDKDIIALFIALKRLDRSIEEIVYQGYSRNRDIKEGLWELIRALREAYDYDSRGYSFLIGKIPKNKNYAPFKRYMMYFRWMVRKDLLDLGLWRSIKRSDLIIPLDTHTHAVSLRLGLLKRKSYDMKSAIELTNTLKSFDPDDPIKYDFALYRIGQESIEV